MSILPAPAPYDRKAEELRGAFGAFATGITVVTVGGATPRGMTANSFTSVSLDPPLVLVCVHHDAVMHQSLSSARHFGVSVLSASQEAVARHFADHSRPLGRQQFENVGWTRGARTGAPLIDGALAHFECERWRDYEGGDHTIFLGAVRAFERQEAQQDALVFSEGRFRRLAPQSVTPRRA
ncbi:flavin reductase family protein [Streptomyces sp. NPDC091292]|uniref:flavin reductase family protein n=1 Tax=Streptomyces sp. NPDC091292 TaxID=3365991 RepID=UPI003827CC21